MKADAVAAVICADVSFPVFRSMAYFVAADTHAVIRVLTSV